MANLTRRELVEILGAIEDYQRAEVEAFCVKHSSKEDFEESWERSRTLRMEDPDYYKEISTSDI